MVIINYGKKKGACTTMSARKETKGRGSENESRN